MPAPTAALSTPTLGASQLVEDSPSPHVESPTCMSEADVAREVDRLVFSMTADSSDEVSNMSLAQLPYADLHPCCTAMHTQRPVFPPATCTTV